MEKTTYPSENMLAMRDDLHNKMTLLAQAAEQNLLKCGASLGQEDGGSGIYIGNARLCDGGEFLATIPGDEYDRLCLLVTEAHDRGRKRAAQLAAVGAEASDELIAKLPMMGQARYEAVLAEATKRYNSVLTSDVTLYSGWVEKLLMVPMPDFNGAIAAHAAKRIRHHIKECRDGYLKTTTNNQTT